MKKLFFIPFLFLTPHLALAYTSADCNAALKQLSDATQASTQSTNVFVSQIDRYSFIPNSQKEVYKKNAILLNNTAKIIYEGGSKTDREKQADFCVNNALYYTEYIKDNIKMNATILAAAQDVEQNKQAIIQQSLCSSPDLCNKTLYYRMTQKTLPQIKQSAENNLARAKAFNKTYTPSPDQSPPPGIK